MPQSHKQLSLLLNPIRRRIYETVCECPGIHFFRLASKMTTSQGTLDWHLRRLEEEELLRSTKYGGKRIFYPQKLTNVECARAFAALRSKTAQQIFHHVIDHPGINQQKIADAVGVHHDTVRYHLTRFETIELVERFRDGREVRVFLGKLGEQFVNGNFKKNTKHFVSFLMEKLREGCLTPVNVSRNEDQVRLQVNCPDNKKFELTINFKGWGVHSSKEKHAVTA
ncbi:MAG: winged helix-turn-helix transcriptional regulator [Candidatus Heimdallarchaeota archaeon]